MERLWVYRRLYLIPAWRLGISSSDECLVLSRLKVESNIIRIYWFPGFIAAHSFHWHMSNDCNKAITIALQHHISLRSAVLPCSSGKLVSPNTCSLMTAWITCSTNLNHHIKLSFLLPFLMLPLLLLLLLLHTTYVSSGPVIGISCAIFHSY